MATEPFTPIDRVGLANHAIDQIERLIADGRLQPGQKLPSERELGAKLGVSRPTLREAIRALTMMGILDSRQGDGTYVREFDAGSYLRPARVLLASRGGLDWLFEVREILEGAAAALAAERVTDPEREEVAVWLAAGPVGEVDPDEVDLDLLRVRDVQLHSLIVSATHNPLLSAIVAQSWCRALREPRHDRTETRMGGSRHDRSQEGGRGDRPGRSRAGPTLDGQPPGECAPALPAVGRGACSEWAHGCGARRDVPRRR